MTLPPQLLRAALKEQIRMGPQTRRPASERLASRASGFSASNRARALAQATRAVAAAEALAREYEAGSRTQASAIAELRRRFPWADAGLAAELGSYGYYLVIM